MSYETWHNYGIGICTDLIETNPKRLRALIESVPVFSGRMKKWCKDLYQRRNWESLTEEDIIDLYEMYGDFGSYKLAGIMYEVVAEQYEIHLSVCDNYMGEMYCLFSSMYPWEMNEKEKSLSEVDIKKLFSKLIGYISDQNIFDLNYGWHSVENGG